MAEEIQNQKCPIAVVIDANIYFSDPALRGPDSLVLLHHLGKIGGKLALPEIVRREVEDKIHDEGSRHAKAIAKGLKYFGRLQDRQLVARHGEPKEWIDGFYLRTKEIDPIPVDVSDNHLRSAYERVMAKTPPNGPKNQQFKDSLLWEAVIGLADTWLVMLVTDDDDFREDKKDNELAASLAAEASKAACGIKIYRDVAQCLEDLKVRSEPVDEKQFIPILDSSLRSEVSHNTQQLGFALNNLTRNELKFYALDTPHLLSVVFDLRYAAMDIKNGSEPRREGVIAWVEGVCFYNEKERSVSEIKLTRLLFDWRNFDGTPGHGGFVFGRTTPLFPLWVAPL